MSSIARWTFGLFTVLYLLGWQVIAPQAAPMELWLSPTDDVSQQGTDFHRLFTEPKRWSQAAGRVRVMSVAVNYLLRTSPDVVRRELEVLRLYHIQLDVSMSVVGTNKKVCGDQMEGMVWPGETALMAKQLKALGVDVASFSLDLPLTQGHIASRPRVPTACEFSVHEVALRTARSVHELKMVYPFARIYDAEVPTGIPILQWTTALESWLEEYKAASGAPFDGLTMDVWWKFPWQETVKATEAILKKNGVATGIIIDESAGQEVTAAAWIHGALQHMCALEKSGMSPNYAVVANWENLNVLSLPETDPTTLTSLINQIDAAQCVQ